MSTIPKGVDTVRGWRLRVPDIMPLIEARHTFQRHILSNGLTVLLQPDTTTSLAHISVAYRVGSMDERPGQSGLAHFLEHMMFAGTRALPGSYMTRMLDAGATQVNAMTMRDITRYFQTVPSHVVELALFAEADRMADFANSLDPAIIERERQVVIEEKRENEGRPLGRLNQWLSEGMLSAGHPYRHPVIGHATDIAHYTAESLREWHATHYSPCNAVLVVTGGFDVEPTFALIERFFGVIPGGMMPPRTEARVEAPPVQSVVRAYDWIDGPGFHVQTWNTASAVASPRENLALSLAADLIGSGTASPLHRKLVNGLGLASAAAVTLTPGRANGMVMAQATLATEGARLEGQIDDVIDAFVSTPVDAEHLDRLRIRRLVTATRSMSEFEQVAARLCSSEAFYGNAGWFLDEARLVAEMDESEIRAAAAKWLRLPSMTLIVLPHGTYPAVTVGVTTVPQPGDPAVTRVNVPAWEETRLRNGTRLRISRRPNDPAFHLRVLSAMGKGNEPEGLEGLASLVTSVPLIGAGPDDAAAFGERVTRAGLSVAMNAASTNLWLDVSGLLAALPAAAAIAADAILRPRYGSNDYERRVAVLATEARGASAPGQKAQRELYALLLGDRHRLAAVAGASPNLIDNLTVPTVTDFHAQAWDPVSTVVLLAGDVDVTEVCEMFDDMMEGWASTHVPALTQRLDVSPATPGIRIVESSGDAVAVTLAWIAPIEGLADEAALGCLVHALAGDFGSRANALLREKRGLTYGVNGSAGQPTPGIGPMSARITTNVSLDAVGEAVRAIEDLLAGLRQDAPPTDAEIEAFRRQERQRLSRLNENAGRAVSTMQDLHTRERAGKGDLHAYRHAVEELSPAFLAAAALRLLPERGRLAGTVSGNRDLIEASLRAADLATPVLAPRAD